MSRWELQGRLADIRTDIAVMEHHRANLVIDLQPMAEPMFGRTHLAKVRGMSTRLPVDREGYTRGTNPRHVSEAAFAWFTERLAALRDREQSIVKVLPDVDNQYARSA